MLFIQFVLDIIKDLLPSRDLPNHIWLSRILVLFSTGILIGVLVFFAIRGTELGNKYGLKPVAVVPVLSHVAFSNSTKEIWETLTELREEDERVRATFVVGYINPATGNFVDNKNDLRSAEALIWIWSIPSTRFASINVLEEAFNLGLTKARSIILNASKCYSYPIEGEFKDFLERGINNFQSTHISVCPIFLRKNRTLIANTVMFYKLDKSPEAVERTAIYVYQDRLNRATFKISNYFVNFNTLYQFYYE